MHIIIKDPETGEVLAILCIERSIHACQILHCDIDHLTEIVNIAFGMKVKKVTLVAPLGVVDEMKSLGWVESEGMVVMEHRNGK
jgi:hypothetical protein